jgi:hypothetical protein
VINAFAARKTWGRPLLAQRLLAVGLLILGGAALYDHDYRVAGSMVTFGVGFWLIGRACMYVLAGR